MMDRVYVIQLDGDAKPYFPEANEAIGNVRVQAPCTVAFLAPLNTKTGIGSLLVTKNGSGIVTCHNAISVDDQGASHYSLSLTNEDSGPLHVKLQSSDKSVSIESTVIVVNASTIALNSMRMLTIMPRNLGHVERWGSAAAASLYAQYDSVHFTPVQPLGISDSCFSIYHPLDVNSDLVGKDKSREEGWTILKEAVTSLESQGLFCTQDVVLNHLSIDSPFVINNPDVGYNTSNCPWLGAAFELDCRIKEFSDKIVDGYYSSKDIGADIRSEERINKITRCFIDDVLSPFKMVEWLRQDQKTRNETIELFTACHGSLAKEGSLSIEQALRNSIGIKRNGLTISKSDMMMIELMDVNQFTTKLDQALGKIICECEGIERDVIGSLNGILRWERLEVKKGPITKHYENRIVPQYFATITSGTDNKEYHLAHNGWVMNWDATKDFADKGSVVYLARRLCVWSDCFKLRYGEGPESCPSLWKTMKQYVEYTADVFKGIRLDNCHSTPLHVAEYMLEAARSKRPDILVYAELFTSNQKIDAKFEARLGLSALIREAQHSRDSYALSCINSNYGSVPIGNVVNPPSDMFLPPAILKYYSSKNIISPRPELAPPILFDQTHDNPAQMELFRGSHILACAGVLAASPFAVGSTIGTDQIVPHHLSVVKEKRCIEALSTSEWIDDESDDIENKKIRTLKLTDINSTDVKVAGTWNNWNQDPMTKKDDHWVYDVKSDDDRIEFKFIIDGTWNALDAYPIDSHGFGNNVLDRKQSCSGQLRSSKAIGIYEARRVLNKLHVKLDAEGYTSCDGKSVENSPLVIYQRHNPLNGDVASIIIHPGFWNQPELNNQDVILDGSFKKCSLLITLDVNDYKKDEFNKNSTSINGLPNNMYKCFVDQDSNRIKNKMNLYCNNEAKTVLKLNRDNFPIGSVLTVFGTLSQNDKTREVIVESIDMIGRAVEEVVKNNRKDMIHLSYLLYHCEAEELASSDGNRGTYRFDNAKSYYAGISTPLKLLDRAIRDPKPINWEKNHSIVRNIISGDWLWDYSTSRLAGKNALNNVREKMTNFLNKVKELNVNRKLLPYLYYQAMRKVFETVKCAVFEESALKISNDPLVTGLLMSSIMFYQSVKDSSLIFGTDHPSISAGLPHFSTGFMRAWGRDTFIALPGLLLTTGRIDEAKEEILGFARTMRHGELPNLLDSGNNSRFNARDATWFFLRALRLTCSALGKQDVKNFLNTCVGLKWNEVFDTYSGMFPSEYNQTDLTLLQLIHVIMSIHREGIEYTEWNAGTNLDENMSWDGFKIWNKYDDKTGLIIGGSQVNCGTWMDKMGSSEKAGNKGVPSTPRDGCPVEIGGMLVGTLQWIVEDLIPNYKFPLKTASRSGKELLYSEWCTKIERCFFDSYYNTKDQHLNDLFGSSNLPRCNDNQLRCNQFIAGTDAASVFKSHEDEYFLSLQNAVKALFSDPNQLGTKTLAPSDKNFRPKYVNDDDSSDPTVAHGACYHQGPEWVWPLGYMMMCHVSVKGKDKCQHDMYCTALSFIKNHRKFIQSDDTMSLPELTQRDGEECIYSAWAQAWSVGTLIEALDYIGSKGKAMGVQAENLSVKVPETEPVTQLTKNLTSKVGEKESTNTVCEKEEKPCTVKILETRQQTKEVSSGIAEKKCPDTVKKVAEVKPPVRVVEKKEYAKHVVTETNIKATEPVVKALDCSVGEINKKASISTVPTVTKGKKNSAKISNV